MRFYGIKRLFMLCLFILNTEAGVDFIYENGDKIYYHKSDVPNIVNVNQRLFVPNILPVTWDTDSKIIPLCVETNGLPIQKNLIESAVNYVNLYLYSGNLDTTALYLYIENYREKGCPEDKLKIQLVHERDTSSSPGYCSRRFLDGTVEHPQILYVGCDITLNMCLLQSSGTFYNVLLHELLHIIGLDHPETRNDSVMSYGVRAKDSTLETIRQDDFYINIQPEDIRNIHAIIIRDFPDAKIPSVDYLETYIPNILPTSHVSGTTDYVLNEYVNVKKCWVSTSSTSQPTSQPTLIPTSQPTLIPTSQPTLIPTLSPTISKNQEKRKSRRRGKWRRRGKAKKSLTDIPTMMPTSTSFTPTSAISPQNIPGDFQIESNITPDIQTSSQVDNFDFDTEISPDIDIDILKGDVVITSQFSPKININGDIRSFKMRTEINPMIRIGQSKNMIKVKQP